MQISKPSDKAETTQRINLKKMPDEEWIKTLEDGRKVKFIYQELPTMVHLSPRSSPFPPR